jgi:hypothetical protein
VQRDGFSQIVSLLLPVLQQLHTAEQKVLTMVKSRHPFDTTASVSKTNDANLKQTTLFPIWSLDAQVAILRMGSIVLQQTASVNQALAVSVVFYHYAA